jgi:hypothetical protein
MRRAILAGLIASAALLISGLGTALGAQQRLTGVRTTVVGPLYEAWSFGDGFYQPIGGADSVGIDRASQWAIPIAVVIPLGARFSLDVSTAYASAEVKLASTDPDLATSTYSISGPTDTKLRLTTKLAGDNVLFTLGINAPTGKTELDGEELAALRVMAAPALGFAMPALGTGSGGTAGVVVARQLGNWAWALGASYEMRAEYSPIAVSGGLSTLDFNPSDAIHLSLGSNVLLGQHQMTLGASADFFGEDELRSGGGAPAAASATQLGPIYTLEWRLDLATRRLREASVFLIERYRTSYEQNGEEVEDSDGSYFDAGLRLVFPAGAHTGLITALSVRHQTGLGSDNTVSTAALAGGALAVGLSRDVGSGYTLQPVLRIQRGTIESGPNSASASALGLGITLSRSF